ncbi:hypothetical protein ACWIGI_30765 [Nocardia sp. NPDC055321]
MGATRIGLGGRSGWSALVAGLCVLGVLEAVVLHFLVTALLPEVVARVVDIVVGAATLVLLAAVASPLWSGVRVTDALLRVRFGWLAALDIPLTSITAIAQFTPPARDPAELGLAVDEDSGHLTVIRSPSSPLLRIEFTPPVPARTLAFRRVRATSLTLSVTDPDSLRAAAGH